MFVPCQPGKRLSFDAHLWSMNMKIDAAQNLETGGLEQRGRNHDAPLKTPREKSSYLDGVNRTLKRIPRC